MLGAWGSSSVWQSAAFAMRRPGVRSPSAPPIIFNDLQPPPRVAVFVPSGQYVEFVDIFSGAESSATALATRGNLCGFDGYTLFR